MVGLTLILGDVRKFRSLKWAKGLHSMKRIEDKVKRKVKYFYVSYKQASERERLYIGMFAVLIITYVWWTILAF